MGHIRVNWKSTKTSRSSGLRIACQQTFPLAIECQGFISTWTSTFLSKLRLSPAEKREYIKKDPKQNCHCIWKDMAFVQIKHYPIKSGSIVRYCWGTMGYWSRCFGPRNLAWTQGHHLMKTLLEAKLLFMWQFLYIIFNYIIHEKLSLSPQPQQLKDKNNLKLFHDTTKLNCKIICGISDLHFCLWQFPFCYKLQHIPSNRKHLFKEEKCSQSVSNEQKQWHNLIRWIN